MRKILLLVTLFVFLLPTVVLAQNDPSCGSLADADCVVLTASQAAMADLKSAAFDLQFTLLAENVPEGDIQIIGIGNGAYDADIPAWNTKLDFAGPTAFARYLASYLHDVSASLNLTLSMQVGADVEALALQMRLVDSVGYLNFDGLRSLTGGGGGLNGWGGLELEALLRYMLDSDPHTFDAYLKGGSLVQSDTPAARLGEIQRVKTVEPGIAVFETRLKLSDLFDDPDMIDAMQQQLNDTMNGADAQFYLSMLQLVVGDSEIVLDQKVRLSDYFTQSLDLSYDLTLARFVDNMLFTDMTSRSRDPLHVYFSYHIEYRQFNAAPAILAPENLMGILDYAGLRRLMLSGGAQL